MNVQVQRVKREGYTLLAFRRIVLNIQRKRCKRSVQTWLPCKAKKQCGSQIGLDELTAIGADIDSIPPRANRQEFRRGVSGRVVPNFSPSAPDYPQLALRTLRACGTCARLLASLGGLTDSCSWSHGSMLHSLPDLRDVPVFLPLPDSTEQFLMWKYIVTLRARFSRGLDELLTLPLSWRKLWSSLQLTGTWGDRVQSRIFKASVLGCLSV